MSDFENDFAPLYMRGVAMISEGEFEEAIALFDQVLEMEPILAEAYTQRGHAKFRLKRMDEALEDLNAAIEIAPHQGEAITYRARLYLHTNRYQEALADLERALEIEPNDGFALSIRALAYYELNQYEAAIADLDRLIELSPDFAPGHMRRALARLYFGLPEEALADIDKFLEMEPDDANGMAFRLEVLETLRRFDEIFEEIDKLPRIVDSEEIALVKGRCLLATDRNEEACEIFEKISDREDDWWVLYGMALSQGRLRRFDACRESLEALQQLADRVGDRTKAIYFAKLLRDFSPERAANLPLFEILRAPLSDRAGDAAAEQGDFEEALRLYDEAIAMNPFWFPPYFGKISSLKELDREETALEAAESALELAPDDERILHYKALLLLDLDRNDEAKETLDVLVGMDPEYAPYYYNRAKALFEKQEFEAAVDDLDKSLQLQENEERALRLRAICHWEMERLDKALDGFSQILYFYPGNVDAMYHRACLYRLMERYEEAVLETARVMETENEHYLASAWLLQGRAWGGLYSEVLEAAEDRKTIAPKFPQLCAGDHYESQQCLDKAVAAFEEAVRLDPEDIEARWYRGYYKQRNKDYLAALNDYLFVTEESPDFASAYYWMGSCYNRLGDYDKAMAAFEKGIELAPEDEGNHYGRSHTLDLMYRFAEAERSFRQGVEAFPENAFLVHHLGHALDYLGRHNEAGECLARSMELHDSIEWFSCMAENLLLRGKPDEAEDVLRKAIEMDPYQAGAYFWLGRIFEWRQQPEQATEMYQLAVRSADPAQRSGKETDYINLVNRAYAMTQLGRHEEALTLFRQYLWDSFETQLESNCDFFIAKSLEALGRNAESLMHFRRALTHLERHHSLKIDIEYCRERIAELEK